MSALQSLDEICPNCGKFVAYLNDITGFCDECSGVGSLDKEGPTRLSTQERLENWLHKNADDIEDLMVAEQITAREAIKRLYEELKPHCEICKDEMPRATPGRHFFCTKKEQCRKARRYYAYLIHERGLDKHIAFARTVSKYTQ